MYLERWCAQAHSAAGVNSIPDTYQAMAWLVRRPPQIDQAKVNQLQWQLFNTELGFANANYTEPRIWSIPAE